MPEVPKKPVPEEKIPIIQKKKEPPPAKGIHCLFMLEDILWICNSHYFSDVLIAYYCFLFFWERGLHKKYLSCCLFCFISVLSSLWFIFLTKIMFLKCPRCQRNLYLKRKSKCRRRKLPQLKVYALVIICDQKDLLAFIYLLICLKTRTKKELLLLRTVVFSVCV